MSAFSSFAEPASAPPLEHALPQALREDQERILPLHSSEDIVHLRRHVRESVVAMGLSLVEQTKFVTAASEIARNTLTHGRGGQAHMEMVEHGGKRGARLRFVDRGLGIANVEQALTDGFSSNGGMGLGLGGAKRLTDEFTIETKVGAGTAITLTIWKHF